MKNKKIAVIGSGPSGLAAIKSCREEGLDVVCFEKSSAVGGLWKYRDEDEDGFASVMKSTVINTHKEMSAFSDFPPPEDSPNFMYHEQMLDYFQSYAKHFNLYPYIRYRQDVLNVTKAEDYEETGRWLVTAMDLNTQKLSEEEFDGVMVCTGHHFKPNIPTFAGQEEFQGKILHSHSLKVPNAFVDRKVLIVGIGNSAVDAAVDISAVAKQVYLSTRRGCWVMPRSGIRGLPFDAYFTSRLFLCIYKVLGWKLCSIILETLVLNYRFDHGFYGIKPKHHFLSQHPTINDVIGSKIITGRVIVKKNISKFTKHGVIFEGESNITEIDAVILGTGYKIAIPFLDESVLKSHNNQMDIYKYVFPPQLKHPSLGIIGMIQPYGSIFPVAESQARWYALLMTGKVKLPDEIKMKEDIDMKRKLRQERYVGSERHTIEVDYIPFLDEIAEQYGAKPNLLKLAISDPLLFWTCLVGPCLAYQYRIHGPHPWPGARNAILKYNKRLCKPLSGGISSSSVPFAYEFRVIPALGIYLITLILIILFIIF